ncbi:hypothetical protein [Cryptosporangium sp. NPDC051539]
MGRGLSHTEIARELTLSEWFRSGFEPF